MAFSTKISTKIHVNIESFRVRAINHHWAPAITKEDIYKLLVKPEHLKQLAETESLVGATQYHRSLSIPVRVTKPKDRVSLQFTFKSDTLDNLLPLYTREGFHSGADAELLSQIYAWVDRRYQIGMGFANVRCVFDILNEFPNPTQMKFYFEGIMALLDLDEETIPHANKIREKLIPGRVPTVDLEIRQAAQQATKFLSNMLLLPKDTSAIDPAPVHFYIEDFGVRVLPCGAATYVK